MTGASTVSKGNGVLTVARALAVLDCFTQSQPEWGVTELSTHLRAHKPAVHRILVTLVQNGYLYADEGTRRYRLGHRLIRLGMLAQQSNALGVACQPTLDALALSTGETATLAVREEAMQRLIAISYAPGPLRYSEKVGTTAPWYAGSTGHALFAAITPEELDSLAAKGFEGTSERGSRSLADVTKRHEFVRVNGYSVSAGEFDSVGSIAAPVFDGEQVIASIGVIGVEQRVFRNRDQIVEEILAASAQLSAILTAGSNSQPK